MILARRRPPRSRRRRECADGRPRDPRRLPRGGRRRRPDGRPRRARRHDGVHRRGDPADDDEARGLGLALTVVAARSDRERERVRNGDLAGGVRLDEDLRELRVELRRPRSARSRRPPRRPRARSRYGRSEVIASNASATASTRPSSGMSPPARRVGYPSPSQRSWWNSTYGKRRARASGHRRSATRPRPDAPGSRRARASSSRPGFASTSGGR